MSNRLLGGILCGVLIFNISTYATAGPESSVVTLYTKTGRQGSGQGSGFVIGPNGLIATAYHVIQGATEIEIFSDRNLGTKDITLVAVDPAHDLALIRAHELGDVRHLELSLEILNHRNEVRVVGSPRGLTSQILFGRPSSPSGVVSSLQVRSARGKPLFARQIDIVPLDVTVYNGMSGAPVVSKNNRVVGILSGSYSEGGGIAWAIPTKYLLELTKREPERRTVGSIHVWPALDLMSSSWVSLKRSYNIPFNAEHIRKLEFLENVMRTIKGKWEGQEDKRIEVFDPFSSCFVDWTEQKSFTFNTIDIEAAKIIGTASIRLILVPIFGGEKYSNLISREKAQESCQKAVRLGLFLAPNLNRFPVAISGDLFVKEPFLGWNRNFDNIKLKATLNVKDCQGHKCDSSLYGRQDLGTLELISDKIIKSELVILRKQ